MNNTERKIVRYKLAHNNTISLLNEEVNTLLSEGWELYGNPFADESFTYQALVRYASHEN